MAWCGWHWEQPDAFLGGTSQWKESFLAEMAQAPRVKHSSWDGTNQWDEALWQRCHTSMEGSTWAEMAQANGGKCSCRDIPRSTMLLHTFVGRQRWSHSIDTLYRTCCVEGCALSCMNTNYKKGMHDAQVLVVTTNISKKVCSSCQLRLRLVKLAITKMRHRWWDNIFMACTPIQA